jgi:hypothetical protein
LEAIRQIIDEELPTRRVRPVADEQVVQARLDFSRDFFRSLTRDVSRQQPLLQVPVPTVVERQQQAERMVQHPNLQVLVGEEYKYLAQ